MESKPLTEQLIRKEKALATTRELQLQQLQGKLLSAAAVEAAWAARAVINCVTPYLRFASRCGQFASPRHAEASIRAELEIALKQIAGNA